MDMALISFVSADPVSSGMNIREQDECHTPLVGIFLKIPYNLQVK